MGRAWDPSHFAQAAPWLPWRAPAGSVLTPKAPPGTAEALEKAEGGLQKRLEVQLDMGQKVPARDRPGAPAWACGLSSGILCGPSQQFPEKAGGLGEESAPSRPPSLQLGSLCACFLQRCRSQACVVSAPQEHKSGDTCQPQAVRPGGTLRQRWSS